MTAKTYTGRATIGARESYTLAVTEATTPSGTHGLRLTCSCSTHKGTSGAAIVATPTAAEDFPKDRIHGFVVLAHDRVAGAMTAKQGKAWKA